MRTIFYLLMIISITVLAACGNAEENTPEGENSDSSESEENTEGESSNNKDETITFGLTSWTSTEAPTEIAKQILEEAGYDVEISLLEQPLIFEGMQGEDVDFFMDAWLPYTEAELWDEYKDDLQKVATSYEDVPLGWVVPSYVEEESIADIKANPEKYDGQIYTIGAGAGIVDISEDVMTDYELTDEFELVPSSESAMISELNKKIKDEEPVVVTGWRPHSMFVDYDLKFLEEPKENFQYDNVYVLSYKGIEDKYPEAYEILSDWSIKVSELEEMMYQYENEDVPFEESAAKWIEDHRDKVDAMLEK